MARRKRKKNSSTNRPGLGAFLGSVIGAAPGAAFGSTPAMAIGSMLGGGVGGYLGASDDRKRRGAIGGAVGGALLGPIGAPIGGYIGGRKPDAKSRKKNPTPMTYAIAGVVGVAAVAGGYGLKRAIDRRKAKKAALPPAQALQGVLGNATIMDSPEMLNDIRQPILLQVGANPLPVDDEFARVPELRIHIPEEDGGSRIVTPAGAAFGLAGSLGTSETRIAMVNDDGDISIYEPGGKAIGHLLTGLSAEANQQAYDLALVHIGEKGVDWWADPEAKDATIQQILQVLAPDMDWSERLKPHTYGSAAWKAWVGVEIVGTVASESLFNASL